MIFFEKNVSNFHAPPELKFPNPTPHLERNLSLQKFNLNTYFIELIRCWFLPLIVIGRNFENKDAQCHIDLIRINEDDISHYVYVKDCSRLLNSQKSKFRNKSYFCKYCHNGFGTQGLLNKHYEKGCMEVEGQQIEMPTPDEH